MGLVSYDIGDSPTWFVGNSTATNIDTYQSTYTINLAGNDWGAAAASPKKEKAAETNLDWLDKRVNEMCVKL